MKAFLKSTMAGGAFVGVPLALSACAQPQHFTKAGATTQSFAADKLGCMETARADNGSQLAFGSLQFVAVAAAAHNQAVQETFDTCMQARGYELSIGRPQQPLNLDNI
jgi:hypothetical protein